MFQGCFKEVLRLFKVLRGVTRDHETNNKQDLVFSVKLQLCLGL